MDIALQESCGIWAWKEDSKVIFLYISIYLHINIYSFKRKTEKFSDFSKEAYILICFFIKKGKSESIHLYMLAYNDICF